MTASRRPFAIRVAVVSALMVAAWSVAVLPIRNRLHNARATLAAQSAEIEEGRERMNAALVEPAEVIDRLSGTAERYVALWKSSDDAARLFDSFDRFAERHGVVIERMEPHSIGRGSPVRGAPEGLEITSIGYGIDFAGSYESVARFLGALQREAGLTRIESLRIVPAEAEGGDHRVAASIKTTHVLVKGRPPSFSALAEDRP